MDQNWIETARTGTFADSRGRPQTFTARDLDAIASAYDPSKRDASLVFGRGIKRKSSREFVTKVENAIRQAKSLDELRDMLIELLSELLAPSMMATDLEDFPACAMTAAAGHGIASIDTEAEEDA